MLECQRDKFDVPRDVCYLNAAGWSPLPKATAEAGRIGAGRKSRPWELPASFAEEQAERTRAAAARLIKAPASAMALIPSIAYGVAIAGKLLQPARGSRVITLADDHSSPVLEWMQRAEPQGFTVDAVARPADGDWTRAVTEAIERPGSPPVSVVSISSLHWSDGGIIDLARAGAAARKAGAAYLIDFTHGAGVNALDVTAIDPDFVLFPTYKWLLGPYGRAFIYIAPRHQDGVPLEQPSYGRRAVKAEAPVYMADTRYLPDARRYDMAERDHFISLDMAATSIEQILAWTPPAIEARLASLTSRMADALADVPGVSISPKQVRAPQMLCVGLTRGNAADIAKELATQKVFVAPRIGRLRISPHVYVDETDADRFVATLRKMV